MQVMILNGPNLNRLGSREPEVYGHGTFADLTDLCVSECAARGLTADVRQTNDESTFIEWLHEATDRNVPVIMNPAAFTHYSYAIHDACAMLTAPSIEVHISNPAAREDFRHTSVISSQVTGSIAGFGFDSYRLAIAALATLLASQ